MLLMNKAYNNCPKSTKGTPYQIEFSEELVCKSLMAHKNSKQAQEKQNRPSIGDRVMDYHPNQAMETGKTILWTLQFSFSHQPGRLKFLSMGSDEMSGYMVCIRRENLRRRLTMASKQVLAQLPSIQDQLRSRTREMRHMSQRIGQFEQGLT